MKQLIATTAVVLAFTSVLICQSVGTSFEGRKQESPLWSVGTPTAQECVEVAKQATLDIQSQMNDPTSFKLLSVIARMKREKDGRISHKGCVHYVGTNVYGAGLQRWGGYELNKKRQLKSWVGGEYSDCPLNKGEIERDEVRDITNEVNVSLSK